MRSAAGRPTWRWRFVLVVGGTWLALLPLYRSPRLFDTLAPLELLTARATAALVSICGMEVERVGAVLRHPAGFAYEIYYACTGLFLAAVLVAGLFALPGKGRAKLGLAVLGVAALFALNLVRLMSLFYIGVHHRPIFDFAHEVAWEALMLGLVLLFWLACLRAMRPPRTAALPSSSRPRRRGAMDQAGAESPPTPAAAH